MAEVLHGGGHEGEDEALRGGEHVDHLAGGGEVLRGEEERIEGSLHPKLAFEIRQEALGILQFLEAGQKANPESGRREIIGLRAIRDANALARLHGRPVPRGYEEDARFHRGMAEEKLIRRVVRSMEEAERGRRRIDLGPALQWLQQRIHHKRHDEVENPNWLVGAHNPHKRDEEIRKARVQLYTYERLYNEVARAVGRPTSREIGLVRSAPRGAADRVGMEVRRQAVGIRGRIENRQTVAERLHKIREKLFGRPERH